LLLSSVQRSGVRMAATSENIRRLARASGNSKMLIAIRCISKGSMGTGTYKFMIDERAQLRDVIHGWADNVMKAAGIPHDIRVLGNAGELDMTRSLQAVRKSLPIRDGRPTVTVVWPEPPQPAPRDSSAKAEEKKRESLQRQQQQPSRETTPKNADKPKGGLLSGKDENSVNRQSSGGTKTEKKKVKKSEKAKTKKVKKSKKDSGKTEGKAKKERKSSCENKPPKRKPAGQEGGEPKKKKEAKKQDPPGDEKAKEGEAQKDDAGGDAEAEKEAKEKNDDSANKSNNSSGSSSSDDSDDEGNPALSRFLADSDSDGASS